MPVKKEPDTLRGKIEYRTELAKDLMKQLEDMGNIELLPLIKRLTGSVKLLKECEIFLINSIN